MDQLLPHGGLRLGAVHEWLGYDLSDQGPAWFPPLALLTAISRGSGRSVIFIGRRCWPTPFALGGTLDRCLFVDADDDNSRLWAIDQALRCPGVVVVGDAARLDMTGSRRLQLAAEAGCSLGLLARPAWERRVLSAAETRWQVVPAPGADGPACWGVELFRCKGAPLSLYERGRWIVEVGRETRAVCAPAAVERGSAAPASRRIA